MIRYLALLGLALLAGAWIILGGRAPRRDASQPATHATAAVPLALVVADSGLSPDFSSVPKGVRVRLEIDHRGARAVSLTLAGYEDRVSIDAFDPGKRWTREFIADRPGDDFVWLLNGRPAGRLAVTGSHLEEGHR